MNINELTSKVIGGAIEVHRELGPGLLEKAYLQAMEHELRLREMQVEKEYLVHATYKGQELGVTYRVDLLVERRLVVELKAIERVMPVHRAQVRSYLHWTGNSLGLILNFNVALTKEGVFRVARSLREEERFENWKA